VVMEVCQIAYGDGTRGNRSTPCITRDPPEEENHFGPPPRLKADHPRGSEIHFGSLICAPVSEPQISTLYLSLIPLPPG
jgi:hypothetical protein